MTNLDKFRVSVFVGACVFLGCGWVVRARAAEEAPTPPPPVCTEKSGAEAKVHAKHGRWITVTTDQWEFLRGIAVMAPDTPRGMPPGDRAVLAQADGQDGGLIFFIDGVLACSPMAVPGELVKILREVDTDNITHVGSGS